MNNNLTDNKILDLTQCLTVDETCIRLSISEYGLGKLLNLGVIVPDGYIGCHMRFSPEQLNKLEYKTNE